MKTTNAIPEGYVLDADHYLSADEWRELLSKRNPKNPATRRLLENGHVRVVQNGETFIGPANGPRPNGPTHRIVTHVDAITENGKTRWTN
jgi:hypothetical protein